MELAEIRTFMTIAEMGSFSRASIRLGIPQPTLSRQLGRLEEDLGTQLFYRHGRGASLTDTGRLFIESIAPVLRDFDRVRGEVIASGGSANGVVRFGIPPSIGRSIAASVVSEFRRRCPMARLHVVEAFSGTLAEWLEDGSVDAAILYDVKRASHIHVSPVLNEELFLVRSGAERLESADVVPLAEVDTEKLILPSRSQGLRRAIEAGFDQANLSLSSLMEIDSIATTKELVETNRLCAILPFGAIHREVSEGRLVAHALSGAPSLSALLVLGTATSQPVTRATRKLLDIVGEQVASFIERGILRGVAGARGNVVSFSKPEVSVAASSAKRYSVAGVSEPKS